MGRLTQAQRAKSVEERFWELVEKTDSCWLWRGRLDDRGYGRFWANYQGWVAHRFSFALTGEKIDGLVVHHTCETKNCVNPAHLAVMENSQHARLHKGEVCARGHPRTEENIYHRRRGKYVIRECMECARLKKGTHKKQPKHWNRENVLAAIRKWAEIHGQPPLSYQWTHTHVIDGYRFPTIGSVSGRAIGNHSTPFASWADAVEAAGYPRPMVGKYDRKRT